MTVLNLKKPQQTLLLISSVHLCIVLHILFIPLTPTVAVDSDIVTLEMLHVVQLTERFFEHLGLTIFCGKILLLCIKIRHPPKNVLSLETEIRFQVSSFNQRINYVPKCLTFDLYDSIINGMAEGEILQDAEVQKAALQVIINCVCGPCSKVILYNVN